MRNIVIHNGTDGIIDSKDSLRDLLVVGAVVELGGSDRLQNHLQ
jgi:hypothetical protein